LCAKRRLIYSTRWLCGLRKRPYRWKTRFVRHSVAPTCGIFSMGCGLQVVVDCKLLQLNEIRCPVSIGKNAHLVSVHATTSPSYREASLTTKQSGCFFFWYATIACSSVGISSRWTVSRRVRRTRLGLLGGRVQLASKSKSKPWAT
jgi:hypothetical protein